jgi:hypothetical protein
MVFCKPVLLSYSLSIFVEHICQLISNFSLTGCSKSAPITRVWSSGLFIIYCGCEKRKMIAFSLLDRQESTRVVFDLIYSRWPDAPSFILYDNACNLHKMNMRLAPHFFGETLHVIDRLHDAGHIRCSPVFSLDHQVIPNCKGRHINSQVAEQGNSVIDLTDFKPSGSNMTQVNFMLSFRFFMFAYNLRIMRDHQFKNSYMSFLDMLDKIQ